MKSRVVVTSILDNDECVGVDRVISHGRLQAGDEGLIAGYITSAREMIEEFTGCAIRRKTYTASFDSAGQDLPWWDGVVEMARGAMGIPCLELPWYPLLSVEEVRTFDFNDNEQIASASSYRVDLSANKMRGRVLLRNGFTWPPIGRDKNGIEVDYTAGHAVGSVPASLSLAVCQLALYFYTNRGDCATPSQCVGASGIAPLLSMYREERIC